MDLFFYFISAIYFLTIFLVSLKWLHTIIIEVDLRPSMTQFLIVSIFTPVVLVTMQISTKYGDRLEYFEHEMKIEQVKYDDLDRVYRTLESNANFLEKLPTYQKIAMERGIKLRPYKFDTFITDLNNYDGALSAYKESYLKLEALVEHYSSDLYEFKASQYNNFKSDNEYFRSKLVYLNNKDDVTIGDRKDIKESFQILDYKTIKYNHEKLEDLHQQMISQTHRNQFLSLIGGIFVSFFMFSLIVILFKIYYIEKIIINKIDKIKKLNHSKQIISESAILKKLLDNLMDSNDDILSIFRNKYNLFKLDHSLESILKNNEFTDSLDILNGLINK